jgi:hypothetical protein
MTFYNRPFQSYKHVHDEDLSANIALSDITILLTSRLLAYIVLSECKNISSKLRFVYAEFCLYVVVTCALSISSKNVETRLIMPRTPALDIYDVVCSLSLLE